jgi:CheY-like chemotaxis protein
MKTKKPAIRYKSVMLIDDNELDNFVNQKIIEANYFADKIYVNTSARSALEFLQNIAINVELTDLLMPEIIFVDINMPLMDGFQFIDQFEVFSKNIKKDIRIAVLTTSVNPEDKHKASLYKRDVLFINKPLTDEALALF